MFCAHPIHCADEAQQLGDLVDQALNENHDIILNLEHIKDLDDTGRILIFKLMDITARKGKQFVCANYQEQPKITTILQLLGKAYHYTLNEAKKNVKLARAVQVVDQYLNLAQYLNLSQIILAQEVNKATTDDDLEDSNAELVQTV